MPFKSEKQRRYLWATHPDIAKRWAHKYPESNKGLPMYANKDESSDSKEKAAQFDLLALIQPYVYKCNTITSTPVHIYGVNSVKSAADKLTYVDIPHSDKPTYAGQERAEGEVKTENTEPANIEHKKPENAINSLLQKLSVVLSQPMAQMLEDRKAAEEGREPAFQPKNPGIRRYAAPVAAVPPPMGSPQAQAQQPAQPQPAPQQGAGMNSPSANPIQSFGPLSASGNINGNAAFGQKNSPDSLKTAAGNPVLSQLTSMDYTGLPDADDLDIDEEYMKTAGSSPAWQRSEGKNDEGGLNAKGRASYNKATGGNLKAPVTESNPSGDRAKRQNSFCSRMCGMKKHETGSKTKKDPDSRINKSLRKWNCKCSAAFEFGEKIAYDLGDRRQSTNVEDRTKNLQDPGFWKYLGMHQGSDVPPRSFDEFGQDMDRYVANANRYHDFVMDGFLKDIHGTHTPQAKAVEAYGNKLIEEQQPQSLMQTGRRLASATIPGAGKMFQKYAPQSTPTMAPDHPIAQAVEPLVNQYAPANNTSNTPQTPPPSPAPTAPKFQMPKMQMPKLPNFMPTQAPAAPIK